LFLKSQQSEYRGGGFLLHFPQVEWCLWELFGH